MRFSVAQVVRVVCVVALAIALLVGLAVSIGAVPPPWKQAEKPAPAPPPASPSTVELVPGVPHTLQVPDEVRRNLGILKGDTELIAEVGPPAHGRALVMSGSTMLDPSRIMRIRARFTPSPSSAEVVEIARVPDHPGGRTVFREIRSGDHVSKGEVLAVFNSVDVGTKKNDLADAHYQLALDEEILRRAEATSSAVPEVFLLNARRNVEVDRNAINRAVNTLQTWGIPEEDIQAVREEAENIKRRQGKRDKEKQASWARVQMRAPDDGVIVERNVSLHEIIADNTTNLFQIAKVDQLTVIAYVPEDDLPALQALPSPDRQWTVQTVGAPSIDGRIDDIGYIIDPNQHTAVVKGHIDNPGERLRAGQFVSATVHLPAPRDVVEVPMDAVIDDGQQSIVFVETNKAKRYYTMRRVGLTERFEKIAYVRSKPFSKAEEHTREEAELELLPRQALTPGERILLTGAGELKIALLDKEAQAKTEVKERKDR